MRSTIVIPPAVHRENQGCVNFTCKARGTHLAWFINERNITQFDDSRLKGKWITIGWHDNTFPVVNPQFCVRRQDLAMPNQLQSLLTVQQPQHVAFVIRQDLEGSYYIGLSVLLDTGEQRWFNLIVDMNCSRSHCKNSVVLVQGFPGLLVLSLTYTTCISVIFSFN